MDTVLTLFNLFYQFINSFSFLILSAVGLTIIYGVMNVINFAHAAFIMLGAVTTVTLVNHFGIPLFLAIPMAALAVGAFGIIIERLVIKRLYERILDCLLATWAINLIVIQATLILLGPNQKGVPTPFGHFSIQKYSYSTYSVFVAAIGVAALLFLYWLFMNTDYGMRTRASIQNKNMAEALGTKTDRIYLITFAIGSSFSGLTGALYSPQMAISPFFGVQFLSNAFTVVIVGGADPLIGPFFSGSGLGLVYSILTGIWGTFVGTIGLLIITMIVIRLMPQGFTGVLERIKEMRGMK